MAYAGGQPEKWYASTLITGMWLATAVLLAVLVCNRGARAPILNPLKFKNNLSTEL